MVCMFSPADAHIAVCDPERQPGPVAVIHVADCARVIVQALREGDHQALLLQARLRDNARAAKPGVWPAAALPADLELLLAVPTTVYHCVQALHDLRWRGKPGATHWQEWLQANAQRDTSEASDPRPHQGPSTRLPPAARWRRKRSHWATCPSTMRQKSPSANPYCSLRQDGPQNPKDAP